MRKVIFIITICVQIVLINGSCCPNSCSGHGVCSTYGNGCVCKCFKGFHAGDCSRRLCPKGKAWSDKPSANDVTHQLVECSNQGTCDYTLGQCICDLAFTGVSCNRLRCPSDCSGHGECRSMKYQASKKDPGYNAPVVYNQVWDNDMIYGCVCKGGFTGPDCSKRSCLTGDDPLTGMATDTVFGQQFNEKQSIKCSATSGTFTLTFRGETTVLIKFDESINDLSSKLNSLQTIRLVTLSYSGTATTACTASGNTITVEFTQNFGSLPLITGNSKLLKHSGASSSVQLIVTKVQDGTKENAPCSNRGTCDLNTGVCTCYLGYTTSNGLGKAGNRGDCGSVLSSINVCPGEIECSGHGYCSGFPQYKCYCVAGWTSGSCAIRTCPMGRAWFDEASGNNSAHSLVECSGMGHCDTSKGECTCMTGFEGGACERMKCPGITTPCNGHGQCLTMAQLALSSEVNGDPAGFTYGSVPNNPNTWDFNKIQGCLCDEGYHGHDCTLRTCPKGDNPRTLGQSHEKQTFKCTQTGTSTFQLSFRGKISPLISSQASVSNVKSSLETLPSIGEVTVSFSSGNVACTAGGTNEVSVVFDTELGDLPSLKVIITDNTKITSFVINNDGVGNSVKGTVENIECSSNGLCDYTKGQCSCFRGVGSSGYKNLRGGREDCGYLIKLR